METGVVDCDDSDCANDPTCSSQGAYEDEIFLIFDPYSCSGVTPSQSTDYATLMNVQAGDYNAQSAGANMPWTPLEMPLNHIYSIKCLELIFDTGGGGSQMPSGNTMSPADLQTLEDWIDDGAWNSLSTSTLFLKTRSSIAVKF